MGLMSVIWLPERFKCVRLLSPANRLASVIWLPERVSEVRLVAFSRPARLLMLEYGALRILRERMSVTVTSPLGLAKAFLTTDSRLTSTNVTGGLTMIVTVVTLE